MLCLHTEVLILQCEQVQMGALVQCLLQAHLYLHLLRKVSESIFPDTRTFQFLCSHLLELSRRKASKGTRPNANNCSRASKTSAKIFDLIRLTHAAMSRLPLGSTVEEVTSAFAQYGPLSDSDPVRYVPLCNGAHLVVTGGA